MGRYESPEYDVVLKEGNYELRSYKNFYVVEYENPEDPDLNYGFGTLFKYISNANDQNEKISMTVPVITQVSGRALKMAFVVPQSKWDNIPNPTDTRLKIVKYDEGLFATISYSGSWSTSREEKQSKLLEAWILDNNLVAQSSYMVAVYNGPFVPPIFRHNEVMVRVSQEV